MEDLKYRKILIVDDEIEIRNMVEIFLRKEGFSRIYHASNCKEALMLCQTEKPDVVILDVMLPDGDGFSLLSSIRKFSQLPVLFLSARGEDEDRLLGLGLGADDYIVKPFLPRELTLRLMAILRRVYNSSIKESLPIFTVGDCIVDLESAMVRSEKGEQPLTAKEHALLLKLYENKGRITTSDALCQSVWGDDYFGYENTLMVHIRRIREKIESEPSKPKYLITVRGLGYKLIVEEKEI
ncbi:response regulator transcription factor [Clostridium sp. Marseille-QA1073]